MCYQREAVFPFTIGSLKQDRTGGPGRGIDWLLPTATTTRSYRLAVRILSFCCHYRDSVESSARQSNNVTNRFEEQTPGQKIIKFSTARQSGFPRGFRSLPAGTFLADGRKAALQRRSNTMYDMAKLKNLSILGEGATKAMSAFWAFDKAALADGVVPKKYKELIALAVALTTQCPYCLELHRAAAEKAGATAAEMAETALVAAALRAGAAITHAVHLIDNHCYE
jgi:AhpD family alkylhydroperoxidase